MPVLISGTSHTYIWDLLLRGVFENVPQDIDGRLWLDSDAGLQALLVYVADQLLRGRLGVGGARGRVGGCRVDGSLVVEAIQVAACSLEVLNPTLGLGVRRCMS